VPGAFIGAALGALFVRTVVICTIVNGVLFQAGNHLKSPINRSVVPIHFITVFEDVANPEIIEIISPARNEFPPLLFKRLINISAIDSLNIASKSLAAEETLLSSRPNERCSIDTNFSMNVYFASCKFIATIGPQYQMSRSSRSVVFPNILPFYDAIVFKRFNASIQTLEIDRGAIQSLRLFELTADTNPLKCRKNCAGYAYDSQDARKSGNCDRGFSNRPLVSAVLGILILLFGLLVAGKSGEYLILGEGFKARAAGFVMAAVGTPCVFAGILLIAKYVAK
jgi:hypothetical protein